MLLFPPPLFKKIQKWAALATRNARTTNSAIIETASTPVATVIPAPSTQFAPHPPTAPTANVHPAMTVMPSLAANQKVAAPTMNALLIAFASPRNAWIPACTTIDALPTLNALLQIMPQFVAVPITFPEEIPTHSVKRLM